MSDSKAALGSRSLTMGSLRPSQRGRSFTSGTTAREVPPQRDDRDLTATVEAQRNVTDAEASAGIADHVSLSPGAHAGMPASQQMRNDRPAAHYSFVEIDLKRTR